MVDGERSVFLVGCGVLVSGYFWPSTIFRACVAAITGLSGLHEGRWV